MILLDVDSTVENSEFFEQQNTLHLVYSAKIHQWIKQRMNSEHLNKSRLL